MANPKAYVNEINSLRAEIKRLNGHLTKLREQKRTVEGYLHEYMESNSIEKYEGITIKSIQPKKGYRKKPTDKKKDALKLFEEVGINDPERFWKELQYTQKYHSAEEIEKAKEREREKELSKTKKKETDYDPFLGF